MDGWVYVCMYVRTYVYLYSCMYVRMYVCVCMYKRIYIIFCAMELDFLIITRPLSQSVSQSAYKRTKMNTMELNCERFQPSATKQMLTAPCWVIAQRVAAIHERLFGTFYRSRLQGSKPVGLLADGTDSFSRTVGKCQRCSLLDSPEERSYRLGRNYICDKFNDDNSTKNVDSALLLFVLVQQLSSQWSIDDRSFFLSLSLSLSLYIYIYI